MKILLTSIILLLFSLLSGYGFAYLAQLNSWYSTPSALFAIVFGSIFGLLAIVGFIQFFIEKL